MTSVKTEEQLVEELIWLRYAQIIVNEEYQSGIYKIPIHLALGHEAIAIAVVGGILMTGGFGSILGVVFGSVTFGLVANAVFFIPWIDGSWFRVFVGTVLLAAVFANERIRKRITGGI